MTEKREPTPAKILPFPKRPAEPRVPPPEATAPEGRVAPLRDPQIVFGAWYHQAEIEKDDKPFSH